jgi:hypothetical protein
MRKGMAIGSAALMVLMAVIILGPTLPADNPGVPTSIEVWNLHSTVYLGDAFRIVIDVQNPHSHNLVMYCTLPPAFGLYDPPQDLMWDIEPGPNRDMFEVYVMMVEPEDHYETFTLEIYDETTESCGELIASYSKDILIHPYSGFTKTATVVGEYIGLNQEIHWEFEITVTNNEMWAPFYGGMYNIVVTDVFGPEFLLDHVIYLEPDTTFAYTYNGNLEITWTIGYLGPLETATLVLDIYTPGLEAPGCYLMNEGAMVDFDRYIPCTTYLQHISLSNEIWVCVQEDFGLRTIGYWKHQFSCALGNKRKAYQHIPTEHLEDFIEFIADSSQIPELKDMDELQDALDILDYKGKKDMYKSALRQLLAAWLNYAAGSRSWDSDGDGTEDTDLMDTILWAEDALLYGDPANYEDVKDLLDECNNSGPE